MRVILEVSDYAKKSLNGIDIINEINKGFLIFKNGGTRYKKRVVTRDDTCTIYMYKGKNYIHFDYNGVYCLMGCPNQGLIIIKEILQNDIEHMNQKYTVRDFHAALREERDIDLSFFEQ